MDYLDENQERIEEALNNHKSKTIFYDITREAKDCDEQEIRIIADTLKALKVTLRKRKI